MKSIVYFAYGSNMLEKVISKRRGISFKRKEFSVLDGWELVFNCPGVNKYEPVFANISPCENEVVEGVLYWMSENEFSKLVKTEGDMYDVINIESKLTGGDSVESKTLVSKKTIAPGSPSLRYISMLIDGAKENYFSESYIDMLSKVKVSPVPPGYNIVCKLVSLYLYLKFFILKIK